MTPARASSWNAIRATASRSSGPSRFAASYIAARQLQKSSRPPPRRSVRPRIARWNACPWAETRPGRIAWRGEPHDSAPATGSPTAATMPSATVSAAPARSSPPARRRVGQVSARRHGQGFVGGAAAYMMRRVPLSFVKYHGLGNDFIVVDGPLDGRRTAPGASAIGAAGSAPTACSPCCRPDRGRRRDDAHLQLRRLGRRDVRQRRPLRRPSPRGGARALAATLVIDTDSGPKRCAVHRDAAGGAVERSRSRWARRASRASEELRVGGETLRAVRVSMGNPHAVLFDSPPASAPSAIGPRDRAAPSRAA